ncbi:hypothetical protein [Nocardioides aquiterrae]|uniref:DUF308 domain-containing protein n=1 Tax=Nocardioides aquiterrae TaxID=203799 RepID=A0ABN1UJN8_9ACTN
MQPDHQPSDGGDGADEAEERAWRAIVENYGDRAEIDESPTAPPQASSAPFGGRFGDPSAFPAESDDEPFVADEEEEGFTPPEPPPLPRVEPDRLLAWAGVLGSPVVLLCALLFSIGMPVWLGYLLVAAFVGGFLYLVVKMPREPRDPWDDGAQV